MAAVFCHLPALAMHANSVNHTVTLPYGMCWQGGGGHQSAVDIYILVVYYCYHVQKSLQPAFMAPSSLPCDT